MITIDLKYLARAAIEATAFKNAETVKMQQDSAKATWNELRQLKVISHTLSNKQKLTCPQMRFEEIFQDDKRAIEKGLCRLMGENEKIADLTALTEEN